MKGNPGVFEREITEANGVTTNREINYIFAPDGLAAIYEKKNGTGKMYYVSTDNLGSINMIADEQGNIVNDLSYDAWGRRRDPYTWQQLTVEQTKALQPSLITDRGYTLHEHIDAFGLINMNGRAYDPLVGQFLSPDPFIQSTTSAQSYNRYSYCWNNPLKFVDPSGYLGDLSYLDILARNYAWGESSTNVNGEWFNTYWYDDQSKEFKSTLKLAIKLQKQGKQLILQQKDNGYHLVYGVYFGQATTRESFGHLSRDEAILMCNLLNSGRQKDENPYESRVMRQSWENSREGNSGQWMDEFNQCFGTMLYVGMGAPLAAGCAPLTVTAKAAGFKFAASLIWQGVVKHKIDLADATLDAFTLPGVGSSLLGGGIDANLGLNKFDFEFRIVGLNKSPEEAIYDASSRMILGSFKSSMNLNVGSQLTGFGDQLIYQTGVSTITGTVNYGIKNEIFQ